MRRWLAAGLSLLAVSSAWTQQQGPAQPGSLERALKDLLDQALRINIVARVVPEGAEPIMNVERSQLTLPGHSVAVRFDGTNLRVRANLTPYLQQDGKLILVAQGEVWVAEPTSAAKAVRYLSSISSLPVALGEKVFFYPLGLPESVEGTRRFTLVLEIQIVPVEQGR